MFAQRKIGTAYSTLWKHLLQMVFICFALLCSISRWYKIGPFFLPSTSNSSKVEAKKTFFISLCSISRIIDKRHHWWDVLAGVIGGISLAVITVRNYPPVDLYLISEKSIWKNQVWRTGFLVDFELDFYCLCSLQKSISKLIFAGWKLGSSNLSFRTWCFKIQVQIDRGCGTLLCYQIEQ